MQAITFVLEYIWNLKSLKGYRTKIATGWFVLASLISTYQEMATSAEFISRGFDLPDIPSSVIVGIISPIGVWMAIKVKQFAKENVSTKP